MRTYKRQQEILEYLEECQYATVSELAGKVFASEASRAAGYRRVGEQRICKQNLRRCGAGGI